MVTMSHSPNMIRNRDGATTKWMRMRNTLKIERFKHLFTESSSKLFSPSIRRRQSSTIESKRSSSSSSSSPSRLSPCPPCRSSSPNEWTYAFDQVINDDDGRQLLTKFLQSEYSEENILFWCAVEELRLLAADPINREQFEHMLVEMYDTFIATDSPLAINIDHGTRVDINTQMFGDISDVESNIFDRAQLHVYRLMEKDCFSRFVHTPPYKDIAKRLHLPQTFRFNGRLSPI